MNAKTSILKNNFISDLENELLNNPVSKKITFEEFKNQIWTLLCLLDDYYFKKLSNQLGLKYIKRNIGNVQFKILEELKILNYEY